jgi:hypothetical protein
MVFLLLLAKEDVDIKTLCATSPKLGMLYQGVYRKGLVTEDNKITLTGQAVLEFLKEETPDKPLAKKKSIDGDFDKWWKAYPGTDTFKHKGQSFVGTRGLRKDKEECKIKFDKILDEGEYTADEMIGALAYEVLQKKENSVKGKVNKLTFMQNSLTYLNQRTFEPFIELVREGNNIVEAPKPTGGTDI